MVKSFTWGEIDDLLDMIIERVDGEFGTIKRDNNMSVLEDSTVYDGYLKPVFFIGTKELTCNADDVVPVGKALLPVVGLCHEVFGHGDQITHEFKRESDLSTMLAANYYACYGSPSYYGFNPDNSPWKQYYKQPHEIAAQYMGLKMADVFLSQLYGKERSFEMLKAVVDYRIECQSEFITSTNGCKSMDDLLDRFDKAYKKREFEHRQYNPSQAGPDALNGYVSRTGKASAYTILQFCQNGCAQDVMLASVCLSENNFGNHVYDTQPAVHRIGIFPERKIKLFAPDVVRELKRTDATLRELESYDVSLSSGDRGHEMCQ